MYPEYKMSADPKYGKFAGKVVRLGEVYKHPQHKCLVILIMMDYERVLLKAEDHPEMMAALAADAEQDRFAAAARASDLKSRKAKERAYDNLHNEGGEGYNPHRMPVDPREDRTPYHKGDDHE